MSTPSFESILSLAILAALVVSNCLCVWRFTSIIRVLSQSTSRNDERNATQRDRFFMQLLEQQAVQSNADKAVAMASVHSAEHLRAHHMDLSRDAAGEKEATKAARMAEHERKHRDRQGNAVGSTTEAFGT